MAGRGLWDEESGHRVKKQALAMVDDAVKTMEALPPPPPSDMFDYTSATMSRRQSRQREGL